MSINSGNLLDRISKACLEGPINYRDYIELVLYADGCGYYKSDRRRVGRNKNADFYTAESLGPVFAQLIASATIQILGKETVEKSTFIEIAAEPGAELLSHLENIPFKNSRVIRHGEAIEANGPVILFANEWLDALPFHRLIFQDGKWRERGVIIGKDKCLKEVILENLSPEITAIHERLPGSIAEGYQLDIPLPAEAAIHQLLNQNWSGLLLLLDYGKTWQNLIIQFPAGTARTYHKHTQANDLLSSPGEKDITCDICWDPLAELLNLSGLKSVTLESQEAFFVKRSQTAAEAIVRDSAGSFNIAKQTLLELIHPTHMGQRFQALWGIRAN